MRGTVVVLCVCVCLSVTALAATYLVCTSKLRHHRVPCGLLKLWIVWISLKILFVREIRSDLPAIMIGDSALSTRNTPLVLDMTRNSTVCEPLARSDDYLK